jgi:Glycosyltransferase family 87
MDGGTRWSRAVPSLLLTGTAAAQALAMVSDISVLTRVVLLGVGSVLFVIAVSLNQQWWCVVAVALALAVAAVAAAPVHSDLWSYQVYGRMVTEFHTNPYVDIPAHHLDDPVVQRAQRMYDGDPSVYGPIFTMVAATVAAATGTSDLPARLAWQGLTAVGAFLAAGLLKRNGASPRAVAAVLVSPCLVVQIVNGAHNDMLVGLAVLAGCLLISSGRVAWGYLALTLGTLVKLPAGIALIVATMWLLSSRRMGEALRGCAVAAATFVALSVPFGLVASLRPTMSAGNEVNATSWWNLFRGDWEGFVWRPVRTSGPFAAQWMSVLAIGLPVLVAGVAAWRMRCRPVHEPVVVGLVAWLVFALYPSGWIWGWVIPAAALLDGPKRIAVAAQACLYFVAVEAWLLPVPAVLEGRPLSLTDRSGAPLLGLSTLCGLALVVWLSTSGPSAASAPTDG